MTLEPAMTPSSPDPLVPCCAGCICNHEAFRAALAITPPLDVEAIRSYFRENGWTIQMDDRPDQPIDPFPRLAARLSAKP